MLALTMAMAFAEQAHASGEFVVRHYRSADGLPVGTVAGSRVDRYGFLWLATHDGLTRFDGREFRIYDAINYPQVGNNRIVKIYRGRTLRTYALTIDGRLLRLEAGNVRRIAFGPEAGDSVVRAVHESPLCVTVRRGLFCEDDRDEFVPWSRFADDLDVAAALPAKQGDTWLLVRDQGIVLQTGAERRVLFGDAQMADAPGILPLATVQENGNLVVVLTHGLLRVTPDGQARWLLKSGEDPISVVQLRHDQDGSLWVGTDRGIFRADQHAIQLVTGLGNDLDPVPMGSWRAPDGALWENMGGRLLRGGTVVLESSGTIQDVSFEADGSAWVSTLRDGLYALSPPRVDALGLEDGLVTDNIYSVARDSAGTMWLGGLNGSVQAVAENGGIRHYGQESGLPGLNTWVVAVAPDDTVYTATYNPGLFRMEAGGERFERVPLPGHLQQARVLAVSFDPAGRMWLGTTAGAWRREGTSWLKHWPDEGGAKVHAILHDSVHDRWLGTGNGVWRDRGGTVEPVASDVFGGAVVRHLFQARGGTIWASTEGRGLVRLDASRADDLGAVRLGRSEGLPSDNPHAVLEDRDGNLWVNSNQGIFRISRANLRDWLSGTASALTPLSLGFSDGITELEGNGGVQPGAARDTGGRFWFPNQRGVIRMHPDAFPRGSTAPAPVIDRLEAGGAVLPMEIDRLPAGLRSISIRYAASDLRSGAAVRFRYRLIPGDERWIDVGGQRTVSLTSLTPGHYRFELIAANDDGTWSTVPATLAFTIPARWYETAYAKLALLAGLLGLVLLGAHLRLREARRHARKLSLEVEARTHDLGAEKRHVESTLVELSQSHRVIERKNLRLAEQASRLEEINDFRTRLFADIGHELRTPLMLASMPIREMREKGRRLSAADRERLGLSLSQMDRLTHLVQQMLCLVQAEAGQIELSITSFDLCELVEEVAHGFSVLGDQSSVRYVVRAEAVPLQVFADRARISTVLGSLLDNASKYAPPGSEVEVRIDVDGVNETMRVAISDSGPGFPPAHAGKLFQRFFSSDPEPPAARRGLGIGLATARELVELHGGRIGASSDPGNGACFWFTLPLGSAHASLDEVALHPPRARTPLPPLPGKPLAARKLLIVEDHHELANYLGRRLEEYCPVQVATSSEQALVWVEREAFGMVLADVVLPGISGLELCKRIKSHPRLSNLPVLLISARGDLQHGSQCRDLGADAYLAKPFNFETLLETISLVWPDASLYFRQGEKIVPGETAAPVLMPALDGLADPDFNIREWARRAYLSERQLRRRVTDLTGQSPVAWLREQRLLRVRKLIGDGSCGTLMEAGARVGLDNPGYLYRIYRARFGVVED